MIKRLTGLALMLLLAACGGDEQTVDFSGWETASLTYSYPADQQNNVPLHAPLVLRFSHALTTSDPASEVSLETVAGDSVPFSVELKANERSLVVTPDATLPPATDLVLRAGDQQSKAGDVETPEAGVRFTTRPRTEGAVSTVATETDFRVARMTPDGDTWPLMDFSTLRLQFTQPIERASVDYGDSGSVVLRDPAGDPVAAHAIASGHALTIDPVNDLKPGKTYELSLTGDLESTLGNALVPGSFSARTITPKNSRPREILVQNAAVSNDDPAQQCGPDTVGDRVSPLTGAPINCVPINATLLGNSSSSQQEGDVHAQLAFVPNYPDVTPLRVPRGSLLQGSNVEVNIAGAVPAGIETGEISVKFISDATGFLLPNPYSNSESAPRHVRLFMDVAMNAEHAPANGSLSQDLMHLQLAGTAIVEDGTMVIDAVGVVEPEVLGLETAHGTLSFHMEAYRDQVSAPPMLVDQTLPAVQSWMPGDDGAGDIRPGDPVIVNFDEPLDRNSLQQAGAITLQTGSGAPVPFDWYLDGASLVVKPDDNLAYGTEYNLGLTGAVTDLAGNPLDQNYSLSFEMPHYVGTEHRAPLAITTYPGYPCVTDSGSRDLANDDQGRCAGGQSSDDHIPVMDLPANRPIVVQFSQTMAKDSISLDGSFSVERSASPDGSGPWSEVPGRLVVKERLARFYPDEPWEDGALYRYTLGSNGDGRSSSAVCDGTDAICSRLPDGSMGYPLQTSMLAQSPDEAPIPTGGGPDMVIHFHGAPATDAVLQTLRNLPTVDTNANMIYDGRSVGDDESGCTPATCEAVPAQDGSGNYLVEENATRIVVTGAGGTLGSDASIGCGVESGPCPDKKFIWLTGGLNAEVVGQATHPETGETAVRVNIFPTIVVTSNLDVYAQLLGTGDGLHTPSGPQIMRMRYDSSSGEPEPVTGWIVDDNGTPVLETELDLYLDAPYLNPTLSLPHNQHSYEITMELAGPVTFLDDGRMQIQQRNTAPVPVNVEVGGGAITIDLSIPAASEVGENGAFLNFLPIPIKE